MKKLLSVILSIAMLLTISVSAFAQEKEIIKVSINAQFAPFEYYDENGELTGFDIELMNCLAQMLGYEIEYSDKPFDALFLSVMSGETDCAISAITVTEERQRNLNYTLPYIEQEKDGETQKYAIAVANNELRERLDSALAILQEDGTIKELITKYQLDKDNYSAYENRASDWAKESVDIAYRVGITDAVEYDFQNPVTREAFCEMIYNLILSVKKEISAQHPQNFTDTDNRKMLVLSGLGIINGKSETELAPKDPLTREEAAAIIIRMINKTMPMAATQMWFEYEDIAEISDWASESVQTISNLGFMNGVDDNKFAPKNTYTTEQAIVTLVRVYEGAKNAGIINTDTGSIIGGADAPTQIMVTEEISLDDFYIDEAMKLTSQAASLAADDEFISHYTSNEDMKKQISKIGSADWSKPQQIYYICANRDEIVTFVEALFGRDAENINVDKFIELHKLNYIQLATMINASYGSENLAALTILTGSRGYIMPKDFEKDFALYLQYDGEYSVLVSFAEYGEGVISANMSFVKNGEKDNVFSRIYEITQGLGEDSVSVAEVK